MGAKSSISWTQSSWSPLRARVKDNAAEIARIKGYKSLVQIAGAMAGHVGHHCEHASTECEKCYSETNNGRCLPQNGTGLPFDRRSRDLIDPIVDEKILLQPLSWRKPRKIFVESQSDLFGEWYTDEMIDRVFAVMALCPQHVFQVLTKRAERMRSYITENDRTRNMYGALLHQVTLLRHKFPKLHLGCIGVSNPAGIPIRWVHFGVSAGTQKAADERIPLLLQTPAAVRWVSIEPQLESIDIVPYLNFEDCGGGHRVRSTKLNWIVIGGESGRGARAFHVEWAENLIDQCRAARVPVFFKQAGANPFYNDSRLKLISHKGEDLFELPNSVRVREYPDAE